MSSSFRDCRVACSRLKDGADWNAVSRERVTWRSSSSAWAKNRGRCLQSGVRAGEWWKRSVGEGSGRLVLSVTEADGCTKNSFLRKPGWEEMQNFILFSALALKISERRPTLLETEAKALEGSANFSWRERSEAMNGLLDLLEQRGVRSGFAFEFLRHAGDLVDVLIFQAKESIFCECCGAGAFSWRSAGSAEGIYQGAVWRSRGSEEVELLHARASAGFGCEGGFEPLLDMRRLKDVDLHPIRQQHDGVEESCVPLAVKVAIIAETLGIARLALYFQHLGMKAYDIPKLLPFVSMKIDVVMAKVEFLRTLGVQVTHLPGILATWPQMLSFPCDSLAAVAEYLTSLGLSKKEIVKMITKSPNILGRPVQELHNTLQYFEDMGVSVKDFKKLVVRYPVLLTDGAKPRVESLRAFFEGIGVQKKHIGGLLVTRPIFLESNVDKDLMPISDYLRSINADADDIDKIVTSFPGLFCYDLEQDFKPTVQQLERYGVEPSLMGKLFRRHPQLLKNRHNFGIRIHFLMSLGLEQKDLGKVIYNAPQLLGLGVEDNMMLTVKFLQSIGVEGPGLLKILKLKPMILAHSVESKLQPNVQFLGSIGIKSGDIGKLVTRYPQLLTLSVEKNLMPTVAYLSTLGFSRSDIAVMVRRLPSLLGFRASTVLGPKYRYLVVDMSRSRMELVRFPQYFSYSLSKRIIPRFERLVLGCNLGSHSLSAIYGCSDALFEKKLSHWTNSSSSKGSRGLM